MRVAVNSRSKQQNRLNCFVDNGVEAHNLDMLMTIDRRGLRGHTLFVASRCQTGEKISNYTFLPASGWLRHRGCSVGTHESRELFHSIYTKQLVSKFLLIYSN